MASTSPLISIIVPVYNVQKSLNRCIESLIAQTYTMLEIILVDDGSTDESGRLCDDWIARDSRVKVIHKSNGGLSDARNAGIDASHGDYLSFVDSDDYVDERFIGLMFEAACLENTPLVMCSVVQEDESGKDLLGIPALPSLPSLNNRQCMELTYTNPGAVTAWSKLYRRSIWNNIRFPKGRLHEDEFVFHEVMYQCETVAIVPERLYHYVQHSGSIMHSTYSIRSVDRIEAWLSRLSAFNQHHEKSNLVDPLIEMILHEVYCTAQLRWNDGTNRQVVLSSIESLCSLVNADSCSASMDIRQKVNALKRHTRSHIVCLYWAGRIKDAIRRRLHVVRCKWRERAA